MKRHRLTKVAAILAGLLALLYLAVSLYLPSSQRMIVGVHKGSGKIRVVRSGITFLPPDRYYRLAFDKHDGYAQRDGVITINSKEGIPLRITYRIRFTLEKSRLPDSRRLVQQGWTSWLNTRVAEAVDAVTKQVPVEDLASPLSQFSRQRDQLARAVTYHLGRSGLEVTRFAIQRIDPDRDALLQYKRVELRRNARGAFGRVAVFAIDGADWELLSELIADGRMPNLKALILGGTTASVQTIQPTVSPMVWTTVATGLTPDRHGVIDFFQNGRPLDALARKAPALWDVANAFGRTSEVVNWWTAWPSTSAASYDAPVDFLPKAVAPAQLAPKTSAAVIPLSSIDYAQARRFLNITPDEFQQAAAAEPNQDPTAMMRVLLSKMWSDHRAAIAMYQATNPSLLMISYDGTDTVNHLFGPYHPPYREGVSTVGYRKYWPAVANFYSEVDRLLGEWTRILPADATAIVMSGYGMTWGKSRPLAPPAGVSALPAHRNLGLFVAFGNHVLPSRERHGMTVYDVAPTVLALLGLPASREMPGVVASWAFRDIAPLQGVNVSSYSEFVNWQGSPAAVAANPATYRARLQMIGHVIDPNRALTPVLETGATPAAKPVTGPAWGRYAYYNNLGVQLRAQNKTAEAADAFNRAIELNPRWPVPYLNLAMILLEKDQFTSSEELFRHAIERGLPNAEKYFIDFASYYRSRDMLSRAINLLLYGKELFPQSYEIAANLGSALAAAKRYTDATAELERALAMQPTSTAVLNNLGVLKLKQEDYGRALDYLNRSLAIDPRQPQIRQGVTAVQSRL